MCQTNENHICLEGTHGPASAGGGGAGKIGRRSSVEERPGSNGLVPGSNPGAVKKRGGHARMSRDNAAKLVNDLINATINAYDETGIKYTKRRRALAEKIITAIAGKN